MADPSYTVPGTTQDERTMAILAHALQMVGGFIAPLIIFLTKRESRFVSFHALQVLLFQLIYMAFILTIMAAFMISIMFTVTHQPTPPAHSGPPPAIFFFFPLVWLGMMGFWVITLVFAIVYSIKAGKGEWAEYPLLGALARRILRIGPGGTFIPA